MNFQRYTHKFEKKASSALLREKCHLEGTYYFEDNVTWAFYMTSTSIGFTAQFSRGSGAAHAEPRADRRAIQRTAASGSRAVKFGLRATVPIVLLSDQNSVRIHQHSWNPKKTTKSTVAKKTTSTKRHATRNTRRGRRKGEKRKTNCTEEARRTTHSHRSKRYYTCRQKMLCLKSKIDQNRICLPSIYERSAFSAVKIRIECQD